MAYWIIVQRLKDKSIIVLSSGQIYKMKKIIENFMVLRYIRKKKFRFQFLKVTESQLTFYKIKNLFKIHLHGIWLNILNIIVTLTFLQLRLSSYYIKNKLIAWMPPKDKCI